MASETASCLPVYVVGICLLCLQSRPHFCLAKREDNCSSGPNECDELKAKRMWWRLADVLRSKYLGRL